VFRVLAYIIDCHSLKIFMIIATIQSKVSSSIKDFQQNGHKVLYKINLITSIVVCSNFLFMFRAKSIAK